MVWFLITFFRANKHWVTKESNLERYSYTIGLWLRIVGLSIKKEHLNMRELIILCIAFSGIVLFLISIVPFSIGEMLGIPYNYYYSSQVLGESNFTLGVDTALIFSVCLLNFFKPLWLLIKRYEIYQVVTHAQELGPVTMPRSCWILTTAYTAIIYINCTNRALLPLRKRELPEKTLMLPGLHNPLESPDFEITCIIYNIGLLAILPNLVCFYGLYIGLAGHITAHYFKLCTEIENLLQEVTIEDSCVVDYEELQKRLSQLIEQHCKVIEVTLNVRMLFNSTFGFDFGVLTLGMGVLLIQVSRIGVITCLDFMTYYIITLIVYCIPGENMRDAADQLPTSVWRSGWEVFKPRERRTVLMVLRSAQKQQILTAGTFVPVTYRTLMMIVKTCFSIYAAFDAAKVEVTIVD